jgi:hypothetical protein
VQLLSTCSLLKLSFQFYREMGIIVFPDTWTLRSLRLTSTSWQTGDLDIMIRRAVVRAFPLVVAFNGVSRREYTDSLLLSDGRFFLNVRKKKKYYNFIGIK